MSQWLSEIFLALSMRLELILSVCGLEIKDWTWISQLAVKIKGCFTLNYFKKNRIPTHRRGELIIINLNFKEQILSLSHKMIVAGTYRLFYDEYFNTPRRFYGLFVYLYHILTRDMPIVVWPLLELLLNHATNLKLHIFF